jgi:hypothetical protein
MSKDDVLSMMVRLLKRVLADMEADTRRYKHDTAKKRHNGCIQEIRDALKAAEEGENVQTN